jgi:hypothetical protein
MIITMCRFNCMNKLPARQAGAAMVEFAILLPLMIVLVFGITEMGRAIYQQNTLSKAVASGARYMSRSAQSVNADCTQAGQWGPSINNAANLVAFGNALLPDLNAGDVSFTLEQRMVTGGDNACVIIATASVEFSAIFGDTIVPFLDLGPITLSATVEERYHGE